MSSYYIDPGCGPVEGETSLENAMKNIRAFISDCEIPLYIKSINGEEEGGRYIFVLKNDEYDYKTEVEMPGLPLDEVKYIGAKGQNIFNFPRLYVDGSSWVWKYAIIKKREVKELLENRLKELKSTERDLKSKIKKLEMEIVREE